MDDVINVTGHRLGTAEVRSSHLIKHLVNSSDMSRGLRKFTRTCCKFSDRKNVDIFINCCGVKVFINMT